MENTERIYGTVNNIIFKNSDNGYIVFKLMIDEFNDSIICVGNVFDIVSGENIEVEGYYDENGKYGRQFRVLGYEKSAPSVEERMIRYLGSGVIKGIGSKLAKSIVDKFGEDTFKIIEIDCIRLAEIRGISVKKAKEINKIFMEQKGSRDSIMYLAKYDIGVNLAIKIYETYEEDAINVVEKNPYALMNDIRGVGFRQIDNIAQKIGLSSNDVNRIAAGILHILTALSMEGHVYLVQTVLEDAVSEFLEIDKELVDNVIKNLHIRREIYVDTIGREKSVYLEWLYKAECMTAKKIKELTNEGIEIKAELINKKIGKLEEEKRIKLADKQKQAIHEVLKNKLAIITGGPGTGKTTLINFVINILKEDKKQVVLAAPTGRAAKRMTEATGYESKTIHRLLEVKVMDEEKREYQRFEKDEKNQIEADVVIVDEVSMLDIYIASSLLRAIKKETKVIFVGDHNQLPSVGPGNFLKDLINSGKVTTVELKEIFRQSADSHIAIYAHEVNNGVYPDITQKSRDFFFIKRNTDEGVIKIMKELIEKRLPAHIGCEPKDIQILTPMRKHILGAENLNKIFQDVVNPSDINKVEKELNKRKFRTGDKVMQIRNNYQLEWEKLGNTGKDIIEGQGVFNGELGEIIDIGENGVVKIMFDDDKVVDYAGIILDEIELSYAMTIHKSQGSEYPVVIVPLLSGPDVLMTRNLLYTAITRAKRMIVLVGSVDMMHRMIDNNKIESRYSGFCERLKESNSKI
ncbi:MAG TPA: ATP-dependent RecD-like DNA helicase [Clostridiales bacterium]|nr:ATP-dependent RecD-like DNA helicase [Clostridiales bacterium]